MTDSHKFQDGGFIPKEVFIETREGRRVQWMSSLTGGTILFESTNPPIWKAKILNMEFPNDQI